MRVHPGTVLLSIAVGLLLFALLRWATTEPASPTRATQIADPAELDSLRRYLGRVGELPPWLDDTGAHARPPHPTGRTAWSAPSMPAPAAGWGGPARRSYTVSAILVQGGRRIAVIDDRSVGPGELLGSGARVVQIGADEVVLQERDGTRTVARLRGEGDD